MTATTATPRTQIERQIRDRRHQLAIFVEAYAETYGMRLDVRRVEADDRILTELRAHQVRA